ncbi:hypothetical protein, partial [Streptomyces sp. NPDC014685]|uniref:hypothetical protein n=1 Tax=Streptomyces sp. NPDC014685 TaxID=3364881 RepID=UPI0036F51D80
MAAWDLRLELVGGALGDDPGCACQRFGSSGLSGAVLGEVGPVMTAGGDFSLDDTGADLRENEPGMDRIRADLTAVTGIAAFTDFADTVPYHLLFTLSRGVARAHRGDQYGDD